MGAALNAAEQHTEPVAELVKSTAAPWAAAPWLYWHRAPHLHGAKHISTSQRALAAPGWYLGDPTPALGHPRPTLPYCTSLSVSLSAPLPRGGKWDLPFVWQGSDRAGLFDKALTLGEHAEKLNPGPFDNLHCFAAKKKKRKRKKRKEKKKERLVRFKTPSSWHFKEK